jgi:single-stranded DNA-specific DHH superfamily exonuclease
MQARDAIEKASNPIIFFDDDADGIASFLLLQRVLGDTLYAPVKKRPNLGTTLSSLATQLGADLKIVLDVAVLDDVFLRTPPQTVWIDHHDEQDPRGAIYLNGSVPTSILVYELMGGPKWIAAAGAVGDYHIPSFIDEVREEHPELVPPFERVEDLLFSSPLGELALIFETCVKGTVRDARRKLDVLRRIREPEELLEATTTEGIIIRRAYERDREEYRRFLTEAIEQAQGSEALFVYRYAHSGHTFTAQLSNELAYKLPDHVIIVAAEYAGAYRLSIRSQSRELPELLARSLKGIEGSGGGHPHACGANVRSEDFERFIKNLKRELDA